MIIRFDKLNRLKTPSIVLCNPNMYELETIDGTIYNTEFTLRYNTMSEMSFTVPSVLSDKSINIWYNLVVAKRLVKVEDIGVFMITTVNKTSDGVQDIKEVTAFSLEVDLNFKKVNLLSGIYKFYNPLNPLDETTLIGKVMATPQMRGWKIGVVSSELWNKTRSYEVSDQTIYNFFMTTIEEAMECIFEYETFTKTINIFSTVEAVKKTDIYLSYDNLIKNLKVEEMSDELVTAMHCYGGGDLTIRGVNPLGDVVIYNFDYFLKDGEKWISDSLKTAIINWQNYQKQQQPIYTDLLVQYRNKNSLLISQKGQLTDLQSQYNAIEGALKIEIEAGGATTELSSQLQGKQNEINTKQSEINETTSQIQNIQSQLNTIVNQVKLINNFTSEQLEELSCYMVESTYTNDAFIQTSIMSAVEIQDMQQELYDFSTKVLEKLSKPRYSFEMESTNFLFIKDFQPFTQQLELGCEVTVDMDNGLYSYPVLLELIFSYDDPTNFTMTFGNRLRLDKNEFRFSELFGESVNTGASVTINQGNWNEFNNNYQDDVSNFIKNELNASQKNIVNATNQEIKIGEHGLIGQKLLDSGSYSPKKVWLMNNNLVFTKDNFSTVEAMFGETSNGAYGVLGDIIVGKILAGNSLTIANDSNTFRVDENGVYIKDANIIMSSGKDLDTTLSDIDGKVSNTINSDGTINTSKLIGSIQAGNNNIFLGSGTNRMLLNENGILITKNNGASYGTAVSADGIVADMIKAGGTIQGCRFISQNDSNGFGMFLESGGLTFKKNNSTFSSIGNSDIALIDENSNQVTLETYSTSYGLNSSALICQKNFGIYCGQSSANIKLSATTGDVYINAGYGGGGNIHLSPKTTSNYVYIYGSYQAMGTKSAIVETQNYGRRKLYSEESDRVYFNTYGKDKTELSSDGYKAIIKLDDIFFQTIEPNSVHPYIINLTSYSNAKVWVKAVYDKYIVVQSEEPTEFDYGIKCIRKDYVQAYLEEFIKEV